MTASNHRLDLHTMQILLSSGDMKSKTRITARIIVHPARKKMRVEKIGEHIPSCMWQHRLALPHSSVKNA